MTLDPHLAGYLRSLAAAGGKPMHLGTVEFARAAFRKLTCGYLSEDQVVPVGSVSETTVTGGCGPLDARIYRPASTTPCPTIVFFHGGGFVIGDLDTHDNICRDICKASGSVVVSVAYRLAPEHPFPAAVEDAMATTRWAVSNAMQLGGTDCIGVAGDSAGGNLAAVVSQQLSAEKTALAGQFLIYPALDSLNIEYPSLTENARGYFLERATIEWFMSHYLRNADPQLDVRAAPLQASSLKPLPPALIVTAGFDPLRDHGTAYAHALHAAGSHAELLEASDMIHGFFDMGRWSPSAQTWISGSAQRFGEMLRASAR